MYTSTEEGWSFNLDLLGFKTFPEMVKLISRGFILKSENPSKETIFGCFNDAQAHIKNKIKPKKKDFILVRKFSK